MAFEFDFAIDMGVAALLRAIKNPKKKEQFRRAFLKVFKVIWTQFQNDKEFQEVVGIEET